MKVVCGAGLLLAALAVGCSQNAPPSSGDRPDGKGGSDKRGNPAAEREPDFRVTAEELCKEYQRDAKVAAAKYGLKWLEIEGKVGSVVTPEALLLAGINPEEGKNTDAYRLVTCFFFGRERELTNLSISQTIKVRCQCSPVVDKHAIQVYECTLSEVGPDPAINVSAVQLTREYAEDEKAADAKYKGKQLNVEGVVAVESEAAGLKPLLVAGFDEGANKPFRVLASYTPQFAERFAAYRKGDKIILKGECTGSSSIIYANSIFISEARPGR